MADPRSGPEVLRARTRALMALMQQEIPGLAFCFKDDPPGSMPFTHRLMHAVARLMVPGYDKRFTTVIHKRIYFPSGQRQSFEQYPERWYDTLRHEFIHLKDFQRFHIFFALSYATLLPLGWTMRAWWERRGYAQNMLVIHEAGGAITDSWIESKVDLFSSRDYVFMELPRARARRNLLALREEILSGKLRGIYPYAKLKTPLPPELEELERLA